ncbi:RadC family protein [Noviherbaspirillum pedocola]|uniref:DNA repair protein RadC n=1 Tax=Noviherbaspirillum pedocola TaxID=2801341 RepID=A0A934SVB3_9BURK|nr:DNA repair protein RadC [Noviherbaspirillum pedocola]MBK4737476.1 DNA repair protein RadC [Noviherbaspirillum pedocola]
MRISDWPESMRPRERLIGKGAHTLSDTELLAIFFRTGLPGKSAIDLAQEALLHFGSLNRLCSASLDEFCRIDGLGPAKYSQLHAVLELARRTMHEDMENQLELSSSSAARDYLRMRMARLPYETFTVLFLDVRNRLIAHEEMFRGTLTHTSVHPREIVRMALRHNAASVILAHNHPSGCPQPSQHDRELTRMLSSVLSLMDIKVLDHFIIAGRHFHSFADHGEL